MEKSPEAFRTISEVAEWLDVPTHVLRFWESRFAQVKPVKRAGGRRYYRPSDMRLIGGIKKLLHDDGMTIRGVQKLLREEGIKYVAAYSRPLDSETTNPDAAIVSFRHAATDAPEPDTGAVPDEGDQPDAVVNTTPEPDPASAKPQPQPEPDIATTPPSPEPVAVEEAEPQSVMQFDSSRGSEETIDLPFIGSARDHPQPVSTEPPPPTPSIPTTPDVPITDAPDDAPEHAAAPGTGARLIVARDRGMIDVGVLTEAARALRAVRDRA